MQFDHRAGSHLEIAGTRVYYEVHGGQDRPAALFLHGGFGNIEDFNELLGDFAGEYRVIGIDSRGHGRSTLGTGGLTYERLSQDVALILRHLSVRMLSVVGFSDGGIVALRLAASHAVDIAKLVVIGTEWHSKSLQPVRELFSSVTGESWRRKFPDTYDAYQRLNPEPDFDRLARESVKMWLDESATGYPNETVREIRAPLLVMRGDEDHLTSRLGAVELVSRVKNAQFLNLPFVGHEVYRDSSGVFRSVLGRFLRSESTSAG